MKKLFFFAAFAALSFGVTSCSDDNNDVVTPESDTTQQLMLKNYVDEVVVPTYRSLADAAISLAEDCKNLNAQADVDKACKDWKTARRYWELSEAFLFGAASDYNIDPHIDSWPLDLAQLDEVLKAGNIEARIEAGTAGYGLLGFHAVEKVIFIDGATGDASNRNRAVSEISDVEKTYAKAVAEDMMQQCVRLEAAWAGLENVSAAKQTILAEAELEPTMNYGEMMTTAGQAGNFKYKTQAAAFEEILIGASDIANEVGNTKIMDPMNDHNWFSVESPHSWNSVADFADNLRSVRNAYFGSLDGSISKLSVSAHVASLNADADKDVRDAIAAAIVAVEGMPTPFRNYIHLTSGAEYDRIMNAVESCNTLVEKLDAAQEVIVK